jgi:hypothetical protein
MRWAYVWMMSFLYLTVNHLIHNARILRQGQGIKGKLSIWVMKRIKCNSHNSRTITQSWGSLNSTNYISGKHLQRHVILHWNGGKLAKVPFRFCPGWCVGHGLCRLRVLHLNALFLKVDLLTIGLDKVRLQATYFSALCWHRWNRTTKLIFMKLIFEVATC